MEDSRLDKLEEKIEAKFEKLIEAQMKQNEISNRQEVNLAKLTVSVEEHVKRSNLHEDEIKAIKADVEPLKASVNKIAGGWKLFIYVFIPLIAAVITTLHFMK
jgi:tRNA U34 5-carboxymethylaminomethyl modifying GTPase MnmE/TrmE